MLDEINLEERAETLNNVLAKIKAGKQSEMTEEEKFSYEVLKKIDESEKKRKAEQETFIYYLTDGHRYKKHFENLANDIKGCEQAVNTFHIFKERLETSVSNKKKELGLKSSFYESDKERNCEELLKDEDIQKSLRTVFKLSSELQEKLEKLAQWNEACYIVDLNKLKVR